jgi:hypothetical protein
MSLRTSSSAAASSLSSSSSTSFFVSERVPGADRVPNEVHLLRSEVQALRAENAQLKKGHAEIIQRLLAESPGSSPSDVVIALKREFGVVFDDTDAYNLLMQHGFNPNDVREEAVVYENDDYDGPLKTFPMAFYSYKGDLEMCRWLHAHGASVDIGRMSDPGPAFNPNKQTNNPMLKACTGGHLAVCQWLVEMGAASDVRRAFSQCRWTPMHSACREGHLHICQWLFEAGAAEDTRKTADKGATPMHLACEGGHLSVCRWLFEVGAAADVTKKSNKGSTPMLVACLHGHLSIMKWLYDVGAAADVRTTNNAGFTPMFKACVNERIEIAQWLFEVGAAEDISTRNSNGFAPMHTACVLEKWPTCQWLILRGALNEPRLGGHIDKSIIERDIGGVHDITVPNLFILGSWAKKALAPAEAFRYGVLIGTSSPEKSAAVTTARLRRALIADMSSAETDSSTATSATITAATADLVIATMDADQRRGLLGQLRPQPPIAKLAGHAGVLELVADFLGGVLRGRELRNVREFAECAVEAYGNADPFPTLEHRF